MHGMEVVTRNDGGEDEGLEDMTLTEGIRRTDETVPRSVALRKRYLVLVVLTIVTTVAILYYAVGAAQRPEGSSSRSSSSASASTSVSNSASNSNSNSPQNTLPSEAMPTGQPSLFPLDDAVQAAPSTQPSLFPVIDPFTEAPSIQPSLFPLNDAIQACLDLYQCQTEHPDRMGHETPLYVGHALCNDHLRFGVTPSGVFQWHDCDTAEAKIIYDDAIEKVSYFSMSSTGVFQLFDQSDAIVWKKEPKTTITFSAHCLPSPLLDCPYLHLHKSGDVVLNSVDATNGWSNRKIEKSFDDLFH